VAPEPDRPGTRGEADVTETQEPRYDGWRIVAPVLAGNLWSEPEPAFPNIDRRASEDRYIELFEKALAAEFPGAEISTEFNDDTEGSPPRPRVTIIETGDVDADSQALEDAIDTIDRLGQDLWDGHDWYVERHYGLKEFAEYLGWGKTRLGNMRDRGQAPAPAFEIGSGPVWTHEQVVAFKEAAGRKADESQTGLRPADSAYDRDFAHATSSLIDALREAGHEVETPVTGAVIVNEIEIPSDQWDAVAVVYSQDGDLEATMDHIRETFGPKE
jgi:hypothetical protein